MGILLGLDISETRIGVALSDELNFTHPLCTITRKERKVDIIAISDLIAIHQVERVVIGLPLSLDGSIGPQAEAIQRFAKRLEPAINIPIEFQDERFTTAEAEDLLREINEGKKVKRERLDEVAAALILRDYLNIHGEPQL